MKRIKYSLWLIICSVFIANHCNAEDLYFPGGEIDKLQKAVSSAVHAVEKVNSAQQEIDFRKDSFDYRKEELETCLNYPESFAWMGDNCQFMLLEYHYAKSDYENAAYDYKSTLDDLEKELAGLENIILWVKMTTTAESNVFDYFAQCSRKAEEINSFYIEAKKRLQ